MSYIQDHVKDWDKTKPDGASETPSVLDNAIKEVKRAIEYDLPWSFVEKTADYSAVSTDCYIELNGSSVTVDIELPSSMTQGKLFVLKATDITNACTLSTAGSETIEGSATYTFSAVNETVMLYVDDSGDYKRIHSDVITDFTNATHDHSNNAGGGVSLYTGAGVFNVKGNFDNLVIDRASETNITITADSGIVYDSSGVSYKVGAISETLIPDNTGANGRDSLEGAVAVGWYHMWAIVKSSNGTIDTFCTKADTYPSDPPTDYDLVAYLGAFYVSSISTTVIKDFHQTDNMHMTTASSVSTTNSSYESKSLSTIVPSTAKSVSGDLQSQGQGIGSSHQVFVAGDSAGLGSRTHQDMVSADGVYSANAPISAFPLLTAQQVWMKVTGGCSNKTGTLEISGWEY